MNRAPGGLVTRLALAVAGASLVVPCAAAKRIAPYRAALAVSWGGGAGSDAFRDDLQRALSANLATGCFAGVLNVSRDGPDPGTDVVLDVVLSEAVDETRFDDSIAGTLEPGEPTKELRRVNYFEVTVDARLTAAGSGAPVQKRHLVARVSRRPVYVGEDAQATARAEAIDDIVHDLTRTLGCGGAKLEKKIHDALGQPAQGTSGPR